MNATLDNACYRYLIPLLGGLALFAGTMSAPAGGHDAQDTGSELFRLPAGKIITAVTFSSDGKQILTGNAERTLMQWDAKTGKELRHWDGNGVETVAISPSGKLLLCDGRNYELILRDAGSGKEVRRLEGHQHLVQAVFSHDGRTILSGSQDETLRLWDVETGKD